MKLHSLKGESDYRSSSIVVSDKRRDKLRPLNERRIHPIYYYNILYVSMLIKV